MTTSVQTPQNHSFGFTVTLCVHLGIFVALTLGSTAGARAVEANIPTPHHFTPVALVELGSLTAQPSATTVPTHSTAQTPAKPIQAKTHTKQRTKPRKSALGIMNASDRAHPIDAGTGTTPSTEHKGHHNGLMDGTSPNATAYSLWVTQVQGAVRRRWKLPSTLDAQTANQLAGKVRVTIRVNQEGRILQPFRMTSSGDPVFDGSVRRAVMAFTQGGGGRLPMPNDPNIKQQITSKGLVLRHWKFAGSR